MNRNSNINIFEIRFKIINVGIIYFTVSLQCKRLYKYFRIYLQCNLQRTVLTGQTYYCVFTDTD